MKRFPIVLCLLLALTLLLAGCGGGFDASEFVQATLDNTYLDDSELYVKLTGVTADEAHEQYLSGLETEAQNFCTYMSFRTAYLTDDMQQRLTELYDDIYAHSKYEVGKAKKNGDSYTVTIEISPIDIFEISMDDVAGFVKDFYAGMADGSDDSNEADEALLEQAYQEGILDAVEARLDSISYKEPVEVTVTVAQDESGEWGMSDEDLLKIDEQMVYYKPAE